MQRVARYDQARRDRSFAVCDDALSANLLLFAPVYTKDVILALIPDLQGEEDDGLPIIDEFLCGLLDDGEFGVECGEGAVAEAVRLLDVGRDVGVWLFEVWEEGFRELFVALGCEIDGFGTVGV